MQNNHRYVRNFALVSLLIFSYAAPISAQLLSEQFCSPGSVAKYSIPDAEKFKAIKPIKDLYETYNLRTKSDAKEFVCTLSNPMNFYEDVSMGFMFNGQPISLKSSFGMRDIVVVSSGENFYIEGNYSVDALQFLGISKSNIELLTQTHQLGYSKTLYGTYNDFIGKMEENYSVSGKSYDYQITLTNAPTLFFRQKPNGSVMKINCRRNHEDFMDRGVLDSFKRNVEVWRTHQCISVCGPDKNHVKNCTKDKEYRQQYVDFFID